MTDPSPASEPSPSPKPVQIRAPKGTRDAYPEDVLRRRYITQAWRDTAIRHGFEEIEGPTFEHADLYAVKSGEGILSELFQAYSGKDEAERAEVQATGRAPYALRPEFTPTLARMYVAKYGKKRDVPVTRWFTAGPYFRAEKPQRGRLREFLQWNCDVIGTCPVLPYARQDSTRESTLDTISTMIGLYTHLGIRNYDAKINTGDRKIYDYILEEALLHSRIINRPLADYVTKSYLDDIISLVDSRSKISEKEFDAKMMGFGISVDIFDKGIFNAKKSVETRRGIEYEYWEMQDWVYSDFSIVRGLGYYTGIVFESLVAGERAVAGGGEYDGLINLFGGANVPACGFGMGDVVLGLLLQDKGLMPEGPALMDAVSRAPASVRPEAFVVTPEEARDGDVIRATAKLRRGVESERYQQDGAKPWDWDARYDAASGGVRPLHARRSDKATRNVGKLFKDALAQHARTFVVLESDGSATIQDLDRQKKFEKLDPGEGLVGLPGMVAAVLEGREPRGL